MNAKTKYIQKQINELEKNLMLIEVRKSEYVEPTDIPLQLVKTEEEIRAKLTQLKVDLARAKAEPSMPFGGQRWVMRLGIVGLCVVLGFIIWFQFGRDPSQTASPATDLTENLTPIPTDDDTLATATTVPITTPTPETFPPLPEVAPPLTTTLLLLSSPQCAEVQNGLASVLTEATKSLAPAFIIHLESANDNTDLNRDAIRTAGADREVDLVVWCTRDSEVIIHFEAITQRANPEVYEPPTLSIPVKPLDRLHRSALGITTYFRRDYAGTERILRTAISMSPEEDVASLLTLLIGNTQLFRRSYATAVTTYQTVTQTHEDWAFAWHNLGVAEMYSAWNEDIEVARVLYESALAKFEQARELDRDFEMPLIAEARVYRRLLDEGNESYEKALNACSLIAQSTNESVRIHTALCQSLILLFKYTMDHDIDPDNTFPRFGDTATLADTASLYWADPIGVAGMQQRAYWDKYGDPIAQSQARQYFLKYVTEAYDDVLLEESRRLYAYTVTSFLPNLENIEP